MTVESRLVKADALRGHLDALLLATLDGRQLHGYAIIEALQQRSGGALDLPTGTVYPALRRLERAGCVHSEWSTVGGRQRRTYRLTPAGAQTLNAERRAWREFTVAIEGVLGSAPATVQA
jgi:PadR family transcriptional regulator, regulatory protein PadR